MKKPSLASLVMFIGLSCLCFCTLASASEGGTEVGNGGDHLPPYHQSAWFLGSSRTVRVCFERAADFPLTAEQAARSVRKAFAHWLQYVHFKGVYETGFLFEAEEGDPQRATLRFAETLDIRPSCDGHEDLVIHLGQGNLKVDEVKRQFSDPLSFAFRERFDPVAGWSKGFLWVRKEAFRVAGWDKPFVLETVLLHEFGHIFGLGHVPGTIMAENFVTRIAEDLEYLGRKGQLDDVLKMERALFMIDTHRELYACLNCDHAFEMTPGKDSLKLLSEVAGRPLKAGAPIRCRFSFQNRYENHFALFCTDADEKPLWTVAPVADRLPVVSGIEAFKRMQECEGALVSESVQALNGDLVYSRLVNPAGKAFTVVLERNLNENSSSLAIKLMRDGKVEHLFDSDDALRHKFSL